MVIGMEESPGSGSSVVPGRIEIGVEIVKVSGTAGVSGADIVSERRDDGVGIIC